MKKYYLRLARYMLAVLADVAFGVGTSPGWMQ